MAVSKGDYRNFKGGSEDKRIKDHKKGYSKIILL